MNAKDFFFLVKGNARATKTLFPDQGQQDYISTYAGHASIYPIARGPVARNPQANLYSEDDAFKIMEILGDKNK